MAENPMSNGLKITQPLQRKRIAVFLDGTWNTVGDNTNVWRLKALCADHGADGLRQVAYYSKGVGTGAGEKVRGGMFGYGLDRAITDAHEWLIEVYELDDEIFIFGFSRGAYTARSLAGFIAECRLLQRGSPRRQVPPPCTSVPRSSAGGPRYAARTASAP